MARPIASLRMTANGEALPVSNKARRDAEPDSACITTKGI
jgi:hypothetical protein